MAAESERPPMTTLTTKNEEGESGTTGGLDISTVGQLVDHLDAHFEEHEPIQFMINDQPMTIEYIEHEGLGEGPVQLIFTSK